MPDLFDGFTGRLWFEGPDGPVEVPCAGPLQLELPRWRLPEASFGGGRLADLNVSFTGTFELTPEFVEWFNNLECPVCGLATKDQPPGHSWSAEKNACWIEEPHDDDEP